MIVSSPFAGRTGAMRLCVALPIGLLAQPAMAQTVMIFENNQTDTDPVSVESRVSGEFQPIGGRIGTFFLYPTGDAAIVATDNVRASPSARADVALDTQIGARLVRPDPRDRVVLELLADQIVHAATPSENALQGNARLYYRHGPADQNNVEVELRAARVAIAREDINNDPAARSPIRYNMIQGEAGYTLQSARFSVQVGGHVDYRDYRDARTFAGTVLDQDFRDRATYTGTVVARLRQSEHLGLIVRSSLSSQNFSLAPGQPAFDPLINFDRDSVAFRIEGGASFYLADSLQIEATAGYSQRRFTTLGQLRQPLNGSGLSVEAKVIWQPNPGTTVRLDAERTYADTANDRFNGNLVTGGRAKVSFSPLRAMILSGSVRFHRYEPLGANEPRNEYGGSVAATQYISRRYRAYAEIRYSGRSGAIITENFRETSGRIGLGISL